MPAWSTPAYRPARTHWTESFYYADISALPATGDSGTVITNTANWHATRGGAYLHLLTFGTDDWQGGDPAYGGGGGGNQANYFIDRWPSGSPRTKTIWSAVNPLYSNGLSHLWFADLRQENAIATQTNFLPQLTGYNYEYTPAIYGDRHAVLWDDLDGGHELVEAIGYGGNAGGLGAQCNEIVTWDLSSYSLPLATGGGSTGVVAADIPVAPFAFTYYDLQNPKTDGTLGHMLGWVAANYADQQVWPARGNDGELDEATYGKHLAAGSVIRLKSSFVIPTGWPEPLKVLARTLKKYGVMLYDKNKYLGDTSAFPGRANLFCPNDPDWPTYANDLGTILGSGLSFLNGSTPNWEVVDLSPLRYDPSNANSIRITVGPTPNVSPTAAFTLDTSSGVAPLTVTGTSTSSDPDGTISRLAWDFDEPLYDKMIVIGDSLSAWGSAVGAAPGSPPYPYPYPPSNRWHDLLVSRGIVGTRLDGSYPGYDTRQAVSSPRIPAQSADLTVIYLGANDQVQKAGASWILPTEYGNNLRTLLDRYPAPKQVLIFPWKWNANLEDTVFNNEFTNAARRNQYLAQAQAVAADYGATLINLGLNYNAPLSLSPLPLPDYLVDRLIHASATGHLGISLLAEAAITGGTTRSHTYTTPGTYTVSLTATDNSSATATANRTVTVSAANSPPVAAFTVSTTSGAAPLTVNFNSAGSYDGDGTIVSRSWDFGDGGTSTATSPSHTFTSPGTYAVALTVTDDQGATGAVTRIITATTPLTPPTAAFTVTPDSGSAAPVYGRFVSTSTAGNGTITGYAWNFGDGGTATTSTAYHTYTSPGTYTITLTVTDSNGLTDSESMSFTVVDTVLQPGPYSLTTAPGTYTQNVTLWLDPIPSTTIDGFFYNYVVNWNWGDGTTTSKFVTTGGSRWGHMYAAPGTYTVTATTQYVGGTLSTDTYTVTVDGFDLVVSTSWSGFGNPGHPYEALISFNNGGVIAPDYVAYEVDFGDGTTTTGNSLNNARHDYPAPGTYTVTATASFYRSNTLAGTTTTTATVLIPDGVNDPPLASFNYTPTGGNAPLTVSFTDTSSDPDGTITGRLWNFGSDGFSTLTNPVHTFVNPGTYPVTLTVTDNEGAGSSVTQDVVLTQPLTGPTAVIDLSAYSGSAPFSFTFASASLVGDAPIVRTEWSFEGITGSPGDVGSINELSPIATYTAPGTYTISLYVEDANLRSDWTTVDVTVTAGATYPPTASFTVTDLGGGEFSFDPSASSDQDGTIVAYDWDFGDNSEPVGGGTVSHTYAYYGSYTVTLTVTDDDGQTGSTTRSVVYALEQPTLDRLPRRVAEVASPASQRATVACGSGQWQQITGRTSASDPIYELRQMDPVNYGIGVVPGERHIVSGYVKQRTGAGAKVSIGAAFFLPTTAGPAFKKYEGVISFDAGFSDGFNSRFFYDEVIEVAHRNTAVENLAFSDGFGRGFSGYSNLRPAGLNVGDGTAGVVILDGGDFDPALPQEDMAFGLVYGIFGCDNPLYDGLYELNTDTGIPLLRDYQLRAGDLLGSFLTFTTLAESRFDAGATAVYNNTLFIVEDIYEGLGTRITPVVSSPGGNWSTEPSTPADAQSIYPFQQSEPVDLGMDWLRVEREVVVPYGARFLVPVLSIEPAAYGQDGVRKVWMTAMAVTKSQESDLSELYQGA